MMIERKEFGRYFSPSPGSTLAESISNEENLFVKYKTELCRNYLTFGSCSYSTRCQFAHGEEELRLRTRHPKYKTELCRNFLNGFCKYGSRCQFVHQIDENRQWISSVEAFRTYLFAQTLFHDVLRHSQNSSSEEKKSTHLFCSNLI